MNGRGSVSPTQSNLAQPSLYDHEFLRAQARWIRDDLDPQVARNGPNSLHSDDILTLDQFLRRLLTASVSFEDMRFSRLHLAIRSISGHATRWPKKLIERADALLETWEEQYGHLWLKTGPLYEPGGRLHGICKPEDVSQGKLMIKWLKAPEIKLGPIVARKVGHLNFNPGDWWISPLFAFKDGVIESASLDGGTTADAESLYAILMTSDEEVRGPSPEAFTYRARNHDRGRYRLTSATRESRQPVRILRSHSLSSLWAPKAGVRYDGLHAVEGWSIRQDVHSKEMVYEIHFKRLDGQPSMEVVLRRPYLDEVEDYTEYKRLRQIYREKEEEATRANRTVTTPVLRISSDGPADKNEQHSLLDESADKALEARLGSSLSGRDSKVSFHNNVQEHR